MSDPLIYFKGLSTPEFYTDLKARHSEYSSFAESINDIIWERSLDESLPGSATHHYSEYKSNLKVEENRNYTEECYDIREKKALSAIKKKIFDDLDKVKTEEFVRLIVNELSQIFNKIQIVEVVEKLQPYKNKVDTKLQKFILYLQETYLTALVSTPKNNPKIQWLGKTNVLATLIYDLWKGQDKLKIPSTKPMLKADKKDLEQLLINNFIDSKGKPLTISTISDYLNTNKEKAAKRAKSGVRIELDY